MSEEKEFLVVRIIVTTITSIIAIMLFFLLNCVIANASSYIARLDVCDYYTGTCYDTNNSSVLNRNGTWYKFSVWITDSNGDVFKPNHSYNIANTIKFENLVPSSSGLIPGWTRQVQYCDTNGNCSNASPDANNSYRVTPRNGENQPYWEAYWGFTIDSSVTARYIKLTYTLSNGIIDEFIFTSQQVIDLNPSVGQDAEAIINSQNGNTDRIIESMLPGIQDAHEIFKNGQSKGTYEGNRRDESGINQADSIEGQIKYGYNNGKIDMQFAIPDSNALNAIWDIVTRIINTFNIMVIVLTATTLMILKQILGRR